jgi:nucleoside-diphosphate-sugar epimerase
MRVLITGATGFVGRQAVAACLRRGHRVAALVLPDDPVGLPDDVALFHGTLSRPPWEAIDAFAPEVCVHAAWVTTPGTYMTSPLNADFEAWSRSFLSHLLVGGLRRVVAAGTCIEYLPVDAEQAQTPYVQCKKRVRAFVEREAEAHDADWVWARIFFPYGVGEPPGKLCRTIVEALLKGERFCVYCPDTVRDYIAVQDVGHALALLVDNEVVGEVDLGTGRPVTVRELGIGIARTMGLDPEVCFEWGDQPDALELPLADTVHRALPGWTPVMALREAIEQLVTSLREGECDG